MQSVNDERCESWLIAISNRSSTMMRNVIGIERACGQLTEVVWVRSFELRVDGYDKAIEGGRTRG